MLQVKQKQCVQHTKLLPLCVSEFHFGTHKQKRFERGTSLFFVFAVFCMLSAVCLFSGEAIVA